MGEWLSWVALARHELLLFCGVWFLIGACDDVAMDLLWVFRRGWPGRGAGPLHLHDISAPETPGLIAIFLPLWDESAVAGQMLAHCRAQWAGQTYRIFAGVYPNDQATCAVVQAKAADNPQLEMVVNPLPGPTTKADCLNQLWIALKAHERRIGATVRAVVLHDAEDLVHADELRLFDRMMHDHDLVQLPVRAMLVPGSPLVSGHYIDEFIESHDKQLVVRSWLGAGLPAAGVGCAFARAMLETIAAREQGHPFDAASLTEDYELGLKIRQLGGRQAIMHVLGQDGSLICTRCCFPSRFMQSARQKARWLSGIALAGWDRLGWTRHPAECWMRVRDRRSIFDAFLVLTAYVTLALSLPLWLASFWPGNYRAPGLSAAEGWIIALTSLSLLWRILVRCWLVARICGWRAALWSPPRLLVGNLIAIAAASRALRHYIAYCFGSNLRWEKTSHYFPAVAPAIGQPKA